MLDTGKDLIQLSDGSICHSDVLGIVEKIRSYDPTLDVLYLDPDKAVDITDAPYIIVKTMPDGRRVRIFSCWELNELTYQRVIFGDTQRFNVEKKMEEHNNKIRQEQKQKQQEALDEASDVTSHLLDNPKTTYRFKNDKGELLTVEDDKGVVKRQ